MCLMLRVATSRRGRRPSRYDRRGFLRIASLSRERLDAINVAGSCESYNYRGSNWRAGGPSRRRLAEAEPRRLATTRDIKRVGTFVPVGTEAGAPPIHSTLHVYLRPPALQSCPRPGISTHKTFVPVGTGAGAPPSESYGVFVPTLCRQKSLPSIHPTFRGAFDHRREKHGEILLVLNFAVL